MFGEPIARREDPRLVAGDGRYLDDLGPEALAAAYVRSPYAHARVVDIDVTDALDVDGLVAIYGNESDQQVRQAIIDQVFSSRGNGKAMVDLVKAEKDQKMKLRMIERMSNQKNCKECSDYLLEILNK